MKRQPNEALIGVAGGMKDLATPALILDADALERNIRAMAEFAKARGVVLRPHAKTHKSVRIARMQAEAGAVGISVATMGEAEVMADGGIEGILVTSPAIQPSKIARLMALNGRVRDLSVVVDEPDNLSALAEAFEGTEKPLRVFVDIDVGSGRTGAPSDDAVVVLAERVQAAAGLAYAGIQAYAGNLQHIYDHAERAVAAREVHKRLSALIGRLAALGLKPTIVSGAGTGTHGLDGGSNVFNELQVGSYVFNDVDYGRVDLFGDGSKPYDPALFVECSVVNASRVGYVVTDGGIKRFAMDGPVPLVFSGAPEGSTYDFMGDEHGKVTFPDAATKLPLGAHIRCVTPHCDPTVNLHDTYHVFRGDTLVDLWPVDARGAF